MTASAVHEPSQPHTYSFNAKLSEGEFWERELDRRFSQWYTIAPASDAEQRKGIDRIFQSLDGAVWTVQYKADSKAAQTGNAFVELVSVDKSGVKGWAYTCQAQLLLYYVPPAATIYVVPVVSLKLALARWQGEYQRRTIPNKGYNTIGLLVPLTVLAGLAIKVLGDGKTAGMARD
jgi:hypothetical protein